MNLSTIESRHNIQFPELYKQMEADGLLDVGEYGPHWQNDMLPRLKERPTLLLHSYDFEVLSTLMVNEAIEELRSPDDYREIDPELKFIPFGQSYGGDHYCFFLNEENENGVPIVMLYHDSDEAVFLAGNLRDFVFRMLLSDMSDQDTLNEVDDETFRDQLTKVLSTHARYLTKEQTAALQELLQRDIIEYQVQMRNHTDEYRGLLTKDEMKLIADKLAPFGKVEDTFPYSSQ